MNFRHLLPIFFVLFFSVISMSGVQHIGKGGGFAEMQALGFDKTFSSLLRACLQSQICGFTEDEQQYVKRFLEQERQIMSSPLLMNSTCQAPFFHPALGVGLSIDSCYLYQETGSEFGPNPKSFVYLAAAVLKVRLSAVSPEPLAPEAIQLLSTKLLQDLRYGDESFAFSAGGQRKRLNIFSIESGGRTAKFIGLEQLSASFDLTGQLLSSLACAQIEPVQWDLQNIVFEEAGHAQVRGIGQIRWSCGEDQYNATLGLELTFQNETILESQVFVLGKQRQ